MRRLDGIMRELVASAEDHNAPQIPDIVREFVESITFADPEEILSALRSELASDWIAMPVWARNLAYRLVCLQRPDDPALLREAAADLLSFGPDWDRIARSMQARAAQLES